MIKLDLHIHSQYSGDGVGSPKEIIKSVRKKGLNGLAITDHNTVEGGLGALKVAPKDFIIIPGIEISSADGHIIALNVKENIPRDLSTVETVDKIIELGGIPIIPHLFRSMSGIKPVNLKKVIDKISAIEVYNACSTAQTNLKTANTAKKFNLGGTGGSDSHIPKFAGNAYTTIDTTDIKLESIINEIEKKKTWGQGNPLPLEYRRDRMIKSIKQYFQRGFKRI
jgi:hypothetical protein